VWLDETAVPPPAPVAAPAAEREPTEREPTEREPTEREPTEVRT